MEYKERLVSELIRADLPILSEKSVDRRNFLKGMASLGLLVTAAPALTAFGWASVPTLEKKLSFYNTHTGEFLKNCLFWADGELNTQAMAELKYHFRDHRTNQEHDLDPDLIHLIHAIQNKTDSTQAIHLISGYRSPKTNDKLRSASCGVAKNSQHLCGKAADIMIPERTMKQVQQAAKSLRAGGVGRYSQFVHVDTGHVRYWGPA